MRAKVVDRRGRSWWNLLETGQRWREDREEEEEEMDIPFMLRNCPSRLGWEEEAGAGSAGTGCDM